MKRLGLALLVTVGGCWLPFTGCGPVSSLTRLGPGRPGKPKKPRKSVKDLEDEVAALRSEKSNVTGRLKAKEKELEEAKLARIQRTLFWIISSAIFVFVVAVAFAIFVKGIRKICIIIALIALAIAGLARVAMWLLPYLLIIGILVVVTFIALAIYYWRADEKSRDQIVTAIDKSKPQLDEKYKGWRKQFRQFIDNGSHKLIRKTRKRLGLAVEEE